MERRRMKERLEEERRKKREAAAAAVADQAKKQNLLSPSPSLDQGLYSIDFRTFMTIFTKKFTKPKLEKETCTCANLLPFVNVCTVKDF